MKKIIGSSFTLSLTVPLTISFIAAFTFSLHAIATPQSCDSIKKIANKDVTIKTTELIQANNDLPQYCRVTGKIKPGVGFEMRLPVEDWNGKFYMTGCGSFCGRIGSDRPGFINAINYGLKRNYAVATMDAGHQSVSKRDSTWAHNNRDAEHSWGHSAVHKTANLTKKAIHTYYGDKPDLSYFAGCSTGGRMAAMEAVRYPNDFDGIISGAPALNYTKLVATYFSWMIQNNTDENGERIISSKELALVEKHIYAECDGKDGVVDGLINDPRACHFKPQELLCENEKSTSCLNKKQISAITKMYSVAKNSDGEKLMPAAVPLGAEHFWKFWFTPEIAESKDGKKELTEEEKGLFPIFNQNFLSYMAFEEDPADKISPMTYDFDVHPQKLDFMSKIYNSDDPNISEFKDRGGKFLLWHGWSDMIVPPGMSIDYYERMISHFGSVKKTQEFARFFLFPGMDHCGAYPGPGAQHNGFDLLTALENWVERGHAPGEIMLTKYDSDKNKVWTRPSCAYPDVAQYDGRSDPAMPSSYSCNQTGSTQLTVQ